MVRNTKAEKEKIQFSKKVVVAVTAAVTSIAFASILLMWFNGNVEFMADVIKNYISYAMVVFAAYSGNSMVEKWLLHRGPTFNMDNSESVKQDSDNNQG